MAGDVDNAGWTKARQLAEIVGLAGVIASLIFVGLELRQNSVATQAATDAAAADAARDFNLAIATSPDLVASLAALPADPRQAPIEDQIRVLAMQRALLHMWANVYRQHMNGTLDPALFPRLEREIESYTSADPASPLAQRGRILRWAWESEGFMFDGAFRAWMDSLLGTSG